MTTPLEHQPTEYLLKMSLEVAAKIHTQEVHLKNLIGQLEGVQNNPPGFYLPGINYELLVEEKDLARLRKDFEYEESRLLLKITRLQKVQSDLNASIAEGEATLETYRMEHRDLITSALKGFPI